MEPFFALSWIITWFSHDVRDTALVKRLFDFFIVSHPLMPVYMSIAMVLHPFNRMEVLEAECDFASVHRALAQLPRNSCSVGFKLVGNQYDVEYVSDDDNNEKFMRVSGTSIITQTKSEDTKDDEASNPPSLASSSHLTTFDPTLVPFEEIIELAIEFMGRIPPRELMPLARYYYDKDDEILDVDPSDITLLHPPPTWALANSIPSDWTLKKRSQEQQRGQPSSPPPPQQQQEVHASKDENSTRVATEDNGRTGRRFSEGKRGEIPLRAVIAAGNGPRGDADNRRKRRRRKQAWIGAVVVAVASSGGVLLRHDISSVRVVRDIISSIGVVRYFTDGTALGSNDAIQRVEEGVEDQNIIFPLSTEAMIASGVMPFSREHFQSIQQDRSMVNHDPTDGEKQQISPRHRLKSWIKGVQKDIQVKVNLSVQQEDLGDARVIDEEECANECANEQNRIFPFSRNYDQGMKQDRPTFNSDLSNGGSSSSMEKQLKSPRHRLKTWIKAVQKELAEIDNMEF